MRNVLILGGNGFIGQNLAQALSYEYNVTVADIRIPNNSQDDKVIYKEFNFVKNSNFSDVLEGIDIVFHLVSTSLPEDGTLNFKKEIEENVFSTINLLEELKNRKNVKFYFMSSGGTVYGNAGLKKNMEALPLKPICKYGVIKATIENMLEVYYTMHGLDYCVIRLSNPYGTRIRDGQRQGIIPILIDNIINEKDFCIWGEGEQIRDYIHIADVVEAIKVLMRYNGEEKIFNIGSGEGYTVNQVLQMIEKELQKPFKKLHYAEPRLCDLEYNVLDITKITTITGWEPKIDLKTGIDKLLLQYGNSLK